MENPNENQNENQTPTPTAAPPPASNTVLRGGKTENEIRLEAELKRREMEIAALQDQNHQLKQIHPAPASGRVNTDIGWTLLG